MMSEFGSVSSTSTYYIHKLAAVALAKHGENYFNNHVPEDRVISGTRNESKEQRALYLKKNKDSVQALDHLDIDRLWNMLVRYEGKPQGEKNKCPYTKRKDCIDRIVAGGYSVENETAYMNQQEREAEAEAPWRYMTEADTRRTSQR